jgi:hypothetical protein
MSEKTKINLSKVRKSSYYQERYAQLNEEFSKTLNRDLDWAEKKLVEIAAFKYAAYRVGVKELKPALSDSKKKSASLHHQLGPVQSLLAALLGRSERVG